MVGADRVCLVSGDALVSTARAVRTRCSDRPFQRRPMLFKRGTFGVQVKDRVPQTSNNTTFYCRFVQTLILLELRTYNISNDKICRSTLPSPTLRPSSSFAFVLATLNSCGNFHSLHQSQSSKKNTLKHGTITSNGYSTAVKNLTNKFSRQSHSVCSALYSGFICIEVSPGLQRSLAGELHLRLHRYLYSIEMEGPRSVGHLPFMHLWRL